MPRAWRIAIVGLRIGLLAAILVLLADPVIVRREQKIDPAEAIVVIDTSRSFSLADPHRPGWQKAEEARALGLLPAVGGTTAEIDALSRRDLACRALAGGWLEEISSRFRVLLCTFDGEVRQVAALPSSRDAPVGWPELPPASGDETRLDRLLGQDLASRVDAPPAGMIVLTDGNHHGPGDPQAAAAAWARRGVPLALVGVGALEPPPDASIEAVDATGRIFEGDEVPAQVAIRSAGLPARDLTIAIEESGRTVKEVVVSLPAGDGLTRAPVKFPAGAPGRKKVTFSFPPQEGEISAANDSRDLWLEVLSEKARVLYLDDRPRYEERYLRAAWKRDTGIDLRHFLLEPPPARRLPTEFPRGRDELFAHDVIVVGDVDPGVFTEEELGLFRDFVTARGAALILLCGERFLPYRWADTPLSEVLPVELLRPAPPPGVVASFSRGGLPLTLTPAGQVSEITRIVPGREQNLELWELLPPPFWAAPIAGIKPGAEILVKARAEAAARLAGMPAPAVEEGKATDPGVERLLTERGAVLVTHVFGAGRVLYLGMDSTWRWRFRFGDELHGRFWGQVVRWAVASRLIAEDGQVRMGTDRVLYGSPAVVTVEALIREGGGRAFEGDLVDAVITRASDGKVARLRLTLIPRSGGRYRGVAELEALGLTMLVTALGPSPAEYKVTLDVPDLPGYSSRPDRATATFAVEPRRDLEVLDLACDVRGLEALASAAGGKFLPFSRFRETTGILRDTSRPRDEVTESRPIDHPWALATLLLGALAAEWILRKRRDLV